MDPVGQWLSESARPTSGPVLSVGCERAVRVGLERRCWAGHAGSAWEKKGRPGRAEERRGGPLLAGPEKVVGIGGEREAGRGEEKRSWAAGWFDGLKREKGNWAGFWDWAGMLGFVMGFPFLFLFFKHYSNLIKFKFKFEFNPSTQTNKRDAPA